MTTIAEVKRWTRPILAEHPDLALKPRLLYLRPVHHIYRTIMFMGSSDRTHPKPRSNYHLLIAPPGAYSSNNWDCELIAGWSTDADFPDRLARVIRESLDHELRPLETIEGLYTFIGKDAADWGYLLERLSHGAPLHAVTPAALGRLSEACDVAQTYIDNNEGPLLQRLARQEEEATRGRRHQREDALSWAKLTRRFLRPMEELRQLIAVAKLNDRQAVAALLHQWEAQNARRHDIEDVWEPTPFPLERDL
tara:strand:+ start:922 stop:1674 length:753 start_codon:yes stop_codon:yes gene_type:complete